MARDESDREDLLREATALVERIELLIDSHDSVTNPIVAGFRANGAFSVFFGKDPVFQFNSAGELRRAYCGGLLFKASRGWLCSLKRVRHANEVVLQRHDLTDHEQAEFVTQLNVRMTQLRAV